MAGRPTKYSLPLTEKILDQVADGESLRRICDKPGMPNTRTVQRWLEKHDDFAAKYTRAREMQADVMDDKINELIETVTPATAIADRVKLDALKWRAAKLKPKVYGDKVDVNHGGQPDNPIKAMVDRASLTPYMPPAARKALEKS